MRARASSNGATAGQAGSGGAVEHAVRARSEGSGGALLARCSARELLDRVRGKTTWSAILTGLKLKIIKPNLKNFEYKSCSTHQHLQLLLQAFSHLKLRLKFRNSNLNSNEITLYTLFFEFFSKFCVVT